MREINLGDLLREEGGHNLAGHDRGIAARRHFGLDAADVAAEPVRVVVPDEVIALTSPFLRGMFGPSVRALGGDHDRFFDHYRFDAEPLAMLQIVRGIESVGTRRDETVAH